MTFITAGLAIAGLAAVAIPILIHLLARQRRKPIEWAAMRFLMEAFRRHKRRIQLEQVILLAVRCLILLLLGFALARPILEGVGLIKPGGSRSIFLVIDDGMASSLEGPDGKTALQRHVEQATELVTNLAPGDAVGIITAARPAKALLAPPSSDRAAVVDILQSLESKQSPTDLPGAVAYVRGVVDDSAEAGRSAHIYLFSDFRAGSAALDAPLPSTQPKETAEATMVASPPAVESVSNVQIVSIEPVRTMVLPGVSDGSGQVTVRLKRTGGQLPAEITTVKLVGEGLGAIAPQVVQWQPGQAEADVEFMLHFANFSQNQVGLTASIDNDALPADNQRFTMLDLRNQIRVLLVDRRSFGFERSLDRLTAGQWIRRALEPLESSPIQIVEAEPAALDLADVRTADVVIAPRADLLDDSGWPILRQFVDQGGLLIVMPPGEGNVHQWTERMATHLSLPWRPVLEVVDHAGGLTLAQEQPGAEIMRLISSDLNDLARPIVVQRTLPLASDSDTGDSVILLADGSPMLVVGSPQRPTGPSGEQNAEPQASAPAARGLVAYLTVAPELEWTNLPTQPLMVPLFHELIRQGLSVISASQRLTVGDQPNLGAGPAARDLSGPDSAKIALDQAGRLQQPLGRAGVYELLDQSGQPLRKLAVNVDPAAGSSDLQSPAAVVSWLERSGPWSTFDPRRIAESLGGQQMGSPIAGILLIIVLALVILETLLARWFSHADRRLDAADLHLEFGSSRKARLAVLQAHAISPRTNPDAGARVST
ncbi:MAG: BatA domain-containing protein [Phycisphaerales bacterium]|nr:BatA domain-containing protein [Phycisphaerales bacterium]